MGMGDTFFVGIWKIHDHVYKYSITQDPTVKNVGTYNGLIVLLKIIWLFIIILDII